LRSIGGVDLTEDNLDNQSGSQSSGSSGNSGGQGGSQSSGSSGNSGGQGGSQGSESSGNSGGQVGSQGSESSGNSGGQVGIQGSGSPGNSGEQGGNQGFKFPGSSSDGQSTDRGSGSPNTAFNRQNDSQKSGADNDKNDGQQDKAKGFPGSADGSAYAKGDRGQKVKPRNTANSGKDRITNANSDRAKPQPENSSSNPAEQKPPKQSPKLPPINAEQLTNLLRIAAIILMLVAGVAWYLWLQSRQEKITKQKERKFNQLPTIERIYWLMLKELRTSGSIKHSNETEWEFARSKTQQLNNNELQYPGLLGKLITEISGDYVAWRYGKKPPNDSSLNHKFERFCELHSEFYAAEQAKHKASSSMISQTKRRLIL
jgi:hypothetical protein